VETELLLDAYAHSAVASAEGLFLSHLVRGQAPALPPDLAAYPAAGTATVTLTDVGAGAGLDVVITHRDAWN